MHRAKALDILRALAVLLVLGRHIALCPPDLSPLFHNVSVIWNRGGWVGVDLFFVLSGFLVSGLLFKEHQKFGRISAKRFLIRRGFKIYPAFWFLIATTMVLRSAMHSPLQTSQLVAELLFFQNYRHGIWVHTWSLAVEEHFYLFLVFSLLLLSLRRAESNPFRVIPKAFLVIAFSCLALRILTLSGEPFDEYTNFYPSHLRIDSLFAGVFVSYLYHYHTDRFMSLAVHHRVALCVSGMLLLVPPFLFPLETTPFIGTVGLTLVYIGSGLLMVSLLTTAVADRGASAALAYLGTHSYSIYLWHLLWVALTIPLIARAFGVHWNWFVYILSYVAGIVCFGILMGTLIEFPALRMRDRWFPSRGATLVGPSRMVPPVEAR